MVTYRCDKCGRADYEIPIEGNIARIVTAELTTEPTAERRTPTSNALTRASMHLCRTCVDKVVVYVTEKEGVDS